MIIPSKPHNLPNCNRKKKMEEKKNEKIKKDRKEKHIQNQFFSNAHYSTDIRGGYKKTELTPLKPESVGNSGLQASDCTS